MQMSAPVVVLGFGGVGSGVAVTLGLLVPAVERQRVRKRLPDVEQNLWTGEFGAEHSHHCEIREESDV